MSAYYNPNEKLETERLLLRPLTASDARGLYRVLAADPRVTETYVFEGISGEDDPRLLRIIEGFSKKEEYGFAIILKETGEFIGMIHQCNGMNSYFRAVEIGYALGSAYWNKGYMTEALRAFVSCLFRYGVHKAFAMHMAENPASGRVMQKAGMVFEGVRKDELFYKGAFHDCPCYALLNPADLG